MPLEAAGVPVRRELDLGPRERVQPALEQGFVDVVPEYAGSASAGRGLVLLEPAPAQNQNGVVVTKAFSVQHGLSRVSDLAALAATLTFGGPSECPTRRFCLLGLTDVYGLRFARFVAIDGADRTRRALEEGIVDAAIMFTTDGQLAGGDLFLLADDRHLQPPENIVPVVRRAALERFGPRVAATLNEVSGRITTSALRLLNWRVAVAGKSPAAEARGWLIREGLIER
jgi:osmoprotectant transport system substrate-binding protein